MKRLLLAAVAAIGICLVWEASAVAQEERSYWVAVGAINEEKLADPESQKLMGAHIEYLGKLYDEGRLLMAGPFGVGEEGMLILKAASKEEALALLHGDPSIAAGLMEPRFLRPWWAAFSRPDNHRFTLDEFMAMMAEGPKPGSDSGEPMGEIHSDEAGSMEGGEWMPEIGAPMFMQVPSTDKSASTRFYSELFGWQIDNDPNTGMTFFTAPGGMMGEFSDMSKPAAPMTGPVFYITTESVTAMLPRVEAAGGKVIQPRMKLPEDWGYIAIVSDLSGNAVGLWSAGE